MHNFQTTHGNEITVAPPQAGEILVGNAIGAWSPVEANMAEHLKVLTQQLNQIPQWKQLAEIPDHDLMVQHAVIDDPKEPDFGMPCIVELQMLMMEVLSILRVAKLIASE